MNNIELECLPNWRYCRIPFGEKGPRYANWQTTPYTLSEVPDDINIGVLLGSYSGGIVAVDFDGPAAWTYWDQHVGVAIPDTVAWTSGKEGRCQMAFRVDQSVWDRLKTVKINLNVPTPEDPKKQQGLEFRWEGGQSVLPPSLHPDTQQPYFWINSPVDTDIAWLPLRALLYWASYQSPTTVATMPREAGSIETITDADFDLMNSALDIIRTRYPRLDYDEWMRTTFAVAQTVGNQAAKEIMIEKWGEQDPGEYERILRSRNPSRSPTLGSLVHRARQIDPDFNRQTTGDTVKITGEYN